MSKNYIIKKDATGYYPYTLYYKSSTGKLLKISTLRSERDAEEAIRRWESM